MIKKAADNKKNFTINLLFTKAARTAWQLIIASAQKELGEIRVLLPAYIGETDREGSGVFDPIRKTKVQYDFYNLNKDLSINFESFESLIHSKQYDIMLLIHYFGFCRSNLKKIAKHCKKNNIILVEDCAHAFQLNNLNEIYGSTGDFSIYSIHKYLPVENGGILRQNKDVLNLLPIENKDKMNEEVAFQLLKSEYKEIAEKRRANFLKYVSCLDNCEGIEIMYELKENEVPQSFPIRIKNDKREKLYFHLMNKRLPTIALYYRLIEEVKKEKFPSLYALSNDILNLPVHQDTETEDIETLTKAIKDFL